KEEHDRGKVDRLQRLPWSDDAECHHQHGTNDRGAGPIALHPRELPEREDEITADKNEVRGERPCVRQERGTDRWHSVQRTTAGEEVYGRRTTRLWLSPGSMTIRAATAAADVP